MKKLLLMPIVALLCSCAVLQNQALTESIVAAGVSVVLSRVPADARAKVAADVNIASGLYSQLVGPNGAPTVEQFAAAVNMYLPNDSYKELAAAALNGLYAGFYPQISAKAPKDQIAYFGNVILAGFKAGAAPYVK